MVQDSGIAEEIVQEAFLRAWQSPKTPHALPAFKAWLYAIILNLVRNHERRRSRWDRLRFFPQTASEAPRIFGDPLVLGALRGLTRREREAVHLRYFEDASYRDAAAVMRVHESTVRVLVNRALGKLRQRLGAAGSTVQEVSE
jgi:RNA polymerase sigma-70 factor (ECF subfamily)